jgi:D-3-phosphoglycerate dehydrogenase
MDKVRVVITDYIEPDLAWEEEQFSKLGVDFSSYQLRFGTAGQLLEVSADADVVIVNMSRMDAQVADGLRRTRLILRHGVGYDNLDVAALTRRGIAVAYIPDYCVNEVAEQAIMLMMACQRKIMLQRRILDQSVAKAGWDFASIYPIYSVHGKTLGIVGCGRIGSTVYRMLQGFGLRFLICDPYLSEQRKHALGIETLPLEAVLKEADIVTMHLPLNEETYHLFDEPQLRMMKRNAILINTARGGLVNLEALDRALREGWIAQAGIDVYEKEPPDPNMPILHNERATCTPHLSWLSEEAGWNIRAQIVDDVRRFVRRQGPKHPVNDVRIQFD